MTFVEADVVIGAPADVIWRVMLDLDGYPRWNPFIVRVDRPGGRPAQVGDDLTLHVRFGNGQRVASRERITRLEPPTVFEYRFDGWMHRTGLIRGRRLQRLDPVDGCATRYHTEERFRGVLGSVVERGVRDGFRRHAEALKRYVENL